jgi:hypothetical protein
MPDTGAAWAEERGLLAANSTEPKRAVGAALATDRPGGSRAVRLLLFAVPLGLLAMAYAHESFTLLMASMAALFTAAAANLTRFRNGLLVLASVSLVWTMAEAVLSTIEPRQNALISIYERDSGHPARFWRLHSDYGPLPRPGDYRATKHTERGDLVYQATYTIGSDGFRSTPQAPSASNRQAFFLGDSATFGEGLNDDQTLPAHWAALNPEYHVTNLAMSAWGLHQAYVVWRDLISDPGAVVIVQTAPWHADRSACIPDFSTFSPKFELIDGTIRQNGKCRVIVGGGLPQLALKRSHVISRLYDVFHRNAQTNKFALYLAIIESMQALADQRHQCLIIAFNKALDSYFVGSTYDNARILTILQSKGIHVIDVTLASSKEELDPSYYIADDGHPTDKANQEKARLLSGAPNQCGRP